MTIEPCTCPKAIAAAIAKTLPLEAIDEQRIAGQILLDPNFCEEGSLLALDNGRPSGFCWALKRRVPLENAPNDSDRGYVVLLGFSWSEEGEALLQSAERFLSESGCTSIWVSPYAPGYFTPGIDANRYPQTADLFTKAGYERRSNPLSMKLDLKAFRIPSYVKARKEKVERDFTFYAYEPWLTVPLLRFAEEEFAGDWVRFARDAAKAILRGDDPGRLQIACKDSQVVGFSHYDSGRFGPIGVSKEIEGQGVGSVLMLRTLEAMSKAGMDEAWFLWTDDRTADRFYKPWGWEESRRFTIFSKKI